MAEEEAAAAPEEETEQPNAEEQAAPEEAAPVEEEPVTCLTVLYTASSLNNFFSQTMLRRLAGMTGEDDLPKVGKLVAVDWPQGKKGHLEVTGLPENVQMLAVDDTSSEEYKAAVLEADVIIAEGHNHVAETRQALETLLDTEVTKSRTFLCLTNVLSWSRTPCLPGEVLCEEDYVRRLGHPNYSELQDLEKRVARAHDKYLRTHVLVAGALYGLGEDIMYDAFKACWEGKPAPMPMLGSNGDNVLPMIHVEDLACGVARLLDADSCPEVAGLCRHMLAVDHGKSTVRQMLEAISSAMADGTVHVLSEDETLLLENNDFFSIHTEMEPAALDVLLQGRWQCKDGLVANMPALTQQFKQHHGLEATRLVVYGPPLSGKTRCVAELASYYGLPVIDLQAAFLEAFSLPEEQWLSPEWGTLATGEEGEAKTPVAVADVEPELLKSVAQWKLDQHQYQCAGWILDAFPATKAQAEAVFLKPPPEVPEGEDPPEVDPEAPPELQTGVLPTRVICLMAEDEALTTRFQELPDEERVEGYTGKEEQESFLAKVAEWRAAQEDPEAAPTAFLKANLPEDAVTEQPIGTWPDTTARVRDTLGAPKNFAGPGHLLSDDWVAPVVEVPLDEPLPVPDKIAAIRAAKAAAAANAATEAEIAENQQLYEECMPLREHLLKVAMPAVTEALVLCCEEQPADSVDFVQKFLFDYEERENRAIVSKAQEAKAKAAKEKAAEKAAKEKAEREKGATEKRKK